MTTHNLLPTVPAHFAVRTLTESVWFPEHEARTRSAEYERVHHHLVYKLDEPCWICGVRRSDGGSMETHHAAVEWSLANSIDPKAILADFPAMGEATDPALRKWLDSEGNLTVLCAAHHRHGLVGIHSVTYPAWVAQRWQPGHDVTTPKPPEPPQRPLVPSKPPPRPPRPPKPGKPIRAAVEGIQ